MSRSGESFVSLCRSVSPERVVTPRENTLFYRQEFFPGLLLLTLALLSS